MALATAGGGLVFLGVAAFCAGLIDAMAGGGGLISLPALLVAGVPPHIALGTNKVQSCLGTSVSTLRYQRHGQVQLPIALTAAAAALLGSYAGSLAALAVPSEWLAAILPWLIGGVAIVTFSRRSFGERDTFARAKPRHYWLAALVGLGLGVYDGFFGPGTGTFLAFAFVLAFGFGFARATGNTKVVNLASNLAAVVAFAASGQVYWGTALVMGAANILGNWLGAGLAIRDGAKVIKPVFAFVLLLLLIRLTVGR